jgi:hypothetical protein
VLADLDHRKAQSIVDSGALVGLGRDGAEQHELLLVFIELAQATFGDGFSLHAGATLALQPPLQLADPQVRVELSLIGRGSVLLDLHERHVTSIRHFSSPLCMQVRWSTATLSR